MAVVLIQILEIDLLTKFHGLHCTFCGAEVALSDIPCPHINFVYFPESEDFTYVSSTFQPTVDAICAKVEAANEKMDNDEDFDNDELDISNHLMALPNHGSNFIVKVIERGLACGPTIHVSYYGFDNASNET